MGIGPQPGASQTVGGSTLPSSPTFRQVFMTPDGLYICLTAGTWSLLDSADAGTVSGSGVTNRLTKWIDGTGSVLGDSGVADDGTYILALRPLAVGYGLSAPAQLLTGPKISAASIISTSPRGIVSAQFSTNTAGAVIGAQKARGTIGTPTTIVTGDVLGQTLFRGYDGTSYLDMGSISCVSTGTIGTNRVPTTLVFSTATDAGPSVLTTALTLGANQSAAFTGAITAIPTITANNSGTANAGAVLSQNTTDGSFFQASARGTTAAGTFLGANKTGMVDIVLGPAAGGVGAIGTFGNFPLLLGTNSTLAMTITTGQAVSFAGAILNPGITTDSGHTDSTVCQDTTSHQLYAGSGAAGICLGTSSRRFKKNISDVKEGLNEVLKLRPRNFRYRKGIVDGGARMQYGLVAEEVEKIIPGIVAKGHKGEINSVDYGTLFPLLTKAIQELVERYDAQIELLNTRLNTVLA